jgi:diamine N-acetyltransferase
MYQELDCKLRSLQISDVDWMLSVENNPEFWIYGDNQTPYLREDIEQFIIESISNGDLQVNQLRKVIEWNDKPVGMVDLFDIDYDHLRAGVGILIFEYEARSRGLAVWAIHEIEQLAQRELGMHQLHCSVRANNVAGIKLFGNLLYKSCGERKDWYRSDADHFESEMLFQKFLN